MTHETSVVIDSRDCPIPFLHVANELCGSEEVRASLNKIAREDKGPRVLPPGSCTAIWTQSPSWPAPCRSQPWVPQGSGLLGMGFRIAHRSTRSRKGSRDGKRNITHLCFILFHLFIHLVTHSFVCKLTLKKKKDLNQSAYSTSSSSGGRRATQPPLHDDDGGNT